MDPSVPLLNSSSSRKRKRAVVSAGFTSGLPYSVDFKSHQGCVNTIAFSPGDGKFLASSGDDMRVLLWDMYGDLEHTTPLHSFRGHRSNVFSLAFTADMRYLYSGARDSMILKYDLSQISTTDAPQPSNLPKRRFGLPSIPHSYPVDIIMHHEASIAQVSTHPSNPSLLLSAGSDGQLMLHDDREPSGPAGAIMGVTEWRGVTWNPVLESSFASCDSGGRVMLHDIRSAFRSGSSRFTAPSSTAVVNYTTSVSRRGTPYLAAPDTSALAFDKTGQMLGVILQRYFPAIYTLNDSIPIAYCTGRNSPDGTPLPPDEQTYRTSCTTKHCTFGPTLDTADTWFSTGSDDFRGYGWKIPAAETLRERRREVGYEQWQKGGDQEEVAFAERTTGPRYFAAELDTPAFRLEGHKSIVNSAAIHPVLPLVATAGIEKIVKLHAPTSITSSPAPTPPARILPATESAEARPRVLASLLSGPPTARDESEPDEDADTLALFDHLLRQDEQEDLWETCRRIGGVDSDENEEEEENEESDEEEEEEEEDEDDEILKPSMRKPC